jgi:hypothetical protein
VSLANYLFCLKINNSQQTGPWYESWCVDQILTAQIERMWL